MRRCLPVLVLALLTGCASAPSSRPDAAPEVVLLGEQHDAAEHHRHHLRTVEGLVARRQLVALVLEMALRGRSTAGLPVNASEQAVREALGWNDQAWPWANYGPSIMAAVRAGVPVLGTNLQMQEMRAAMADERWDQRLPAEALRRQREAIRTGHCGLLPEARIAPMARVQIARDAAMAQVIESQLRPGKTVVLIAGSGHVEPQLGVPRHLPAGARIEATLLPQVATGKDYCAGLRQQLAPRSPS